MAVDFRLNQIQSTDYELSFIPPYLPLFTHPIGTNSSSVSVSSTQK